MSSGGWRGQPYQYQPWMSMFKALALILARARPRARAIGLGLGGKGLSPTPMEHLELTVRWVVS